ncbi:MAG TPA: ABC transporter permease [Bryobacteraceae bacterium]|nr:ABC transporter permease [Bryobacteraceae bacterium]
MRWGDVVRLRGRSIFRRARVERELDDELRFHFDQQIEENLRAGMSAEEARYAARRVVGGLEQIKEKCRDTRGTNWLTDLQQDIRYGLRTLAKNRGFTAVAILTLALGIGANTAIFTLLHAALWKPLPVEHPEEIYHLMRVSSVGDFKGEFSISYPLFQQLAKAARPWGEVVATGRVGPRKFGIGPLPTEHITGESVSGNYFSVLGVGPILGRVLEAKDDSVLGGNHVAVLSDAFWRRRFQAQPSVLGKTIYVDESPYTVVGVAQPGFAGSEAEAAGDVWIPVTAEVPKEWLTQTGNSWLRLLARLAPGEHASRAQAALEGAFRAHVADALLPSAAPRWKSSLESQHMTIRSAPSGLATTGREYEKPLLALLAVVAVVLLIACANIANLILARNAAREHEIQVRLALGASHGRIARQLFTENLILSLLGAACAVALATWATRLLLSLLPEPEVPLAFDLRPDLAVLGFTAAIAVLTAILFGLGPALRSSKEQTNLRGGRRITGAAFSGRLLLAGQLALSLPLLVGAGLFLETLRNLEKSDLGFRSEQVTTFDLAFPKATSDERVRQAYGEIQRRLESQAGVAVAGYAWPGLYDHGGWSNGVEVEGHVNAPGEDNEVGAIGVSPGLFKAAGIGLLQGRYINTEDQATNRPVVVVNQSFARYYFGNTSPIGRHVTMAAKKEVASEIVGVVRDAKHYGIRERTWRMVYVPGSKDGTFYVRSNLGVPALTAIIRSAVAATDKTAQVERIRPFEADVDSMISQENMVAILSTVFALLACAITTVGLYGVVAYGVSRRTSEFGIRMALGARQSDIRGLVLKQTLVVILGGVALGAAVAWILARVLTSALAGMLYGIQPTDILVFAAGVAWLVAIALLAAFLPARRASRADPMVALRYE